VQRSFIGNVVVSYEEIFCGLGASSMIFNSLHSCFREIPRYARNDKENLE